MSLRSVFGLKFVLLDRLLRFFVRAYGSTAEYLHPSKNRIEINKNQWYEENERTNEQAENEQNSSPPRHHFFFSYLCCDSTQIQLTLTKHTKMKKKFNIEFGKFCSLHFFYFIRLWPNSVSIVLDIVCSYNFGAQLRRCEDEMV